MSEDNFTKDITKVAQKRVMPQSELDLQLMTTDSVWGKETIPPDLRKKLLKALQFQKEGKVAYDTESLWDLLGIYTRDLRLANLSVWNGELEYCRYFLDLASDFLQSSMIDPFIISLSRAATVLETSQSKDGFLRRRTNTITSESFHKEMEPPKKNLFGVGKKQEGGF